MKSKFIPKSQKKPPPKKEVVGQIVIEVYNDNTHSIIVSKTIHPEFARLRLMEYAFAIGDRIVLMKMKEMQGRAKVLDVSGKPIMSINQEVKQ